MQVSMATSPAKAGEPNEDFTAATTNGVVLLDGAGLSGTKTRCQHGVAWYTRHLGGALLSGIVDESRDLTTTLAEAIAETADLHRNTCDLDDPGTPSATVVMVRTLADRLQYLVLADSVLVLDEVEGKPSVISDTREAEVGKHYRTAMDAIANGTPDHDEARRKYVETLRSYRNRPGGFWVAAANPAAAAEAITGDRPLTDIAGVLLLSDGASRIADRFGLIGWKDVLALVSRYGPEEIIRRVRQAEMEDPHGARWPRGKTHDDATAAFCTALADRTDRQSTGVSTTIRRRRTELGMSQAELAATVGIDKRQIRRYEAGEQQPVLFVAVAIANALKITVDELAGSTNQAARLFRGARHDSAQ